MEKKKSNGNEEMYKRMVRALVFQNALLDAYDKAFDMIFNKKEKNNGKNRNTKWNK